MSTLVSHAGERADMLRDLVRSALPATSVYFGAAPPHAPARDQSLRWDAVRHRLEEQGAPIADIAALTVAVGQLPPGDHTFAGIAAGGSLRLQTVLDHFDGADVAVYGPWPRIVPLLRWQQQRVPSVVAVVGHGHANAVAYDDDGRPAHGETIVGLDDEIERNAPGGWSQDRYHRRAEDSWMHNANQFVAHITRLADVVRARLLLLAGDGREVSLVLDRLPSHLRTIARTDVSARPGHDGSVEVTLRDLRTAVAAAAERERRALLADLDEAVSRHLAVEGAQDVSRSLDSGAVRRLVVVAGVVADPLADALVAAALDADTDVTVAEPGDVQLVGGVGALLRF